ncbi:hypothetical protein GS434_24495 [Rhodococcus hoagii]|nr:hypothetical protein [Prescottella equi]
MNRFSTGAILLYLTAVIAQALTWPDLGSAERSSRVVLLLLAAALLTAILGSRADRARHPEAAADRQ